MNTSPKKLNIIKFSFCSRHCFQVEYSVWKLLLWLVDMDFPIQNLYIHTSRENRQQKQLWNRTFHFESRGISKNLGPYHNSKTQSECNETLSVTKYLKISVMKRFFKTSFILKSEHFLWSKLQHRIKSWNYVLKFKCSQNVRSEHTRKRDHTIK